MTSAPSLSPTQAPTNVPCPVGTFRNSSGSCSPVSVCAPGSFVLSNATLSSDRECSPCEAGQSFQPAANRAGCDPVSVCIPSVEFQAMPPTLTSDRLCQPITNCTADEFIARQPTATTNRLCQTLTACVTGEFAVVPSTSTSDRLCQALRNCTAGEVTSVVPTATSDRECVPCPTTCPADMFLAVPCHPNTTLDTLCAPCRTCQPSEVVIGGCEGAFDRVCQDSSSTASVFNHKAALHLSTVNGGSHSLLNSTSASALFLGPSQDLSFLPTKAWPAVVADGTTLAYAYRQSGRS